MSVTAIYDLNGPLLVVSGGEARHLAAFDRVLAPLRTRSGTADLTVVVQTGEPDGDIELPLGWEGVLPEGIPARWFVAGRRSALLSPGRFRLDLDQDAGRAELVSTDDGMTARAPVLVCAEAALREKQLLLHAACLRLPDCPAAMLLFGASGRGKTTTALALALGGFALAGDDAGIVRRDCEGWRAWGLPRPLKVHHRTLVLLPRLGHPATSGETEITLTAASAEVKLAGTRPMPLAALVFLADRGEQHRLLPLSSAEATIACATDNVGTSMLGVLPDEAQRFARIADLCRSVPAQRLSVGRDLEDLADFLRRRLER